MRAKNLLAAIVTLALASTALAQDLKPVVQTQIESVRARVQNDGDNAYFLFSEGVVLRATNMLVECDKLEVFASRQAEEESNIGKFGAIKEIIASGNVRIVQQERTATCERAVVQPNKERIVLTGNPVVEQPGGRLATFNPDDEIILDRGNGKITVNTQGGRKLRLTSSAIGDLGFEDQGPVPTTGVEELDGEAPEVEVDLEMDVKVDGDEESATPAETEESE